MWQNVLFLEKNSWKSLKKIKATEKLETISIIQANIEVWDIAYVVFYNGLNSDYHFIIKELAKQFEGKFESLEENSEKYKTFFVLIETEKLQKLMKMAIKIL